MHSYNEQAHGVTYKNDSHRIAVVEALLEEQRLAGRTALVIHGTGEGSQELAGALGIGVADEADLWAARPNELPAHWGRPDGIEARDFPEHLGHPSAVDTIIVVDGQNLMQETGDLLDCFGGVGKAFFDVYPFDEADQREQYVPGHWTATPRDRAAPISG